MCVWMCIDACVYCVCACVDALSGNLESIGLEAGQSLRTGSPRHPQAHPSAQLLSGEGCSFLRQTPLQFLGQPDTGDWGRSSHRSWGRSSLSGHQNNVPPRLEVNHVLPPAPATPSVPRHPLGGSWCPWSYRSNQRDMVPGVGGSSLLSWNRSACAGCEQGPFPCG